MPSVRFQSTILRAFVTVLVLARHSSLAYTTFAHADAAQYLMSTVSSGPLWFIWLLLLIDVIVAGVFSLLRKLGSGFALRSVPKVFLVVFLVSFFTYVPMIAWFGAGAWIPFFFPPAVVSTWKDFPIFDLVHCRNRNWVEWSQQWDLG